jgi:ATP-dependent phosphoenolpyruvate carboxykinase
LYQILSCTVHEKYVDHAYPRITRKRFQKYLYHILDGADYYVINAGEYYAPKSDFLEAVPKTKTCVAVNLPGKRITILGTQYAGEMKKGLFGLMHYLMP